MKASQTFFKFKIAPFIVIELSVELIFVSQTNKGVLRGMHWFFKLLRR